MRKLLSSMILTSMLTSGAAYSLTNAQKNELYETGNITIYDDDGKKLGHYEVNFIPGKDNIIENQKNSWKRAADLMDDFVDRHEFWEKKFVGSFFDGMDYVKKGIREGVMKVPEDFKETLETNREARESFGYIASGIKNWISFGATVAGRVLRTVWGAGAGTVYSIVVPTGHILYRPIAAGTDAIIAGTLWPVMRYTWNGAAWVMVKENAEPKENDITVTFVPERIES